MIAVIELDLRVEVLVLSCRIKTTLESAVHVKERRLVLALAQIRDSVNEVFIICYEGGSVITWQLLEELP